MLSITVVTDSIQEQPVYILQSSRLTITSPRSFSRLHIHRDLTRTHISQNRSPIFWGTRLVWLRERERATDSRRIDPGSQERGECVGGRKVGGGVKWQWKVERGSKGVERGERPAAPPPSPSLPPHERRRQPNLRKWGAVDPAKTT